MSSITAERLRQLLHYDAQTGDFTWKARTSNRIKIGDVAGSLSGEGYLTIRVDGELYQAHRLAVLYQTGSWPAADVDHKDRNRTNNTWKNLRDVSRSVNQQNQVDCHASNISGRLGVNWDATRGKWKVRIKVNGKTMFLGRHTDLTKASAIYMAAKREHHEGCTL